MPMIEHRKSVNRIVDKRYESKKTWAQGPDTSRSQATSISLSLSTSSSISDSQGPVSCWSFGEKNSKPKSPTPSRLDAGGLVEFCERKPPKRIVQVPPKKKKVCGVTAKCKANLVFIPPPDKVGGVSFRCGVINTDKNKATQTMYRESSAQTLPYLPPVCNLDQVLLEDYEIFKLPTILPGDGPPGLYEVEVLERARKRWAFAKALRTKLRNQMKEVREELKKSEYKMILEAFEWEHWIEREEYIQEIQMLRLELVIRMFDKREKELLSKSHAVLEMKCKEVKAKRDAKLRKNDLEYSRALRRLEMRHNKMPRIWRKEEVIKELGDPSSEFYGPQMRYGVNPNRRHYPVSRKEFEKRIDILDTKVALMKSLECPFEKINRWAKPKERVRELEKNFCSEQNLKNLYDTLKGLRRQSMAPKEAPRCLIEKPRKEAPQSDSTLTSWRGTSTSGDLSEEGEESDLRWFIPDEMVCKDRKAKRLEYLEERRAQEIEILLARYEGSSVGWLMRFLANEEKNLIIQRKVHYISSIAQKERCRREALAALLEKKENQLRERMEYLYDQSIGAQEGVAEQYYKEIMDVDTKLRADCDAKEAVTELAKQVDMDIQRWLVPRPCLEGTFNYESLRYLLKELIFPCPKDIIESREKEYIGRAIAEEILEGVLEKMEAHDIGINLADEVVDRAIDTDLLYFTSECSCCSESDNFECDSARREALAIIRKVIRQAVPGRRWKEPTERLVHTNVEDLIDGAFDEVHRQWEESGRVARFADSTLLPAVRSESSYYDLANEKTFEALADKSSSDPDSQMEHMEEFQKVTFVSGTEIGGPLETDEPARISDDKSNNELNIVLHTTQYRLPSQVDDGQDSNKLHEVMENINILERECFTDITLHKSKTDESSFSSAVITTICFDYAPDKTDTPDDDTTTQDKEPCDVKQTDDSETGPDTDEVMELLLDCVFKRLEAPDAPCDCFAPADDKSVETSSSSTTRTEDSRQQGKPELYGQYDSSSSSSFSGYTDTDDDSVDFPPNTVSEPVETGADHGYIQQIPSVTSCPHDTEGQLPLCQYAAPKPKLEPPSSPTEEDSQSSLASLKIQWICPRKRFSK